MTKRIRTQACSLYTRRDSSSFNSFETPQTVKQKIKPSSSSSSSSKMMKTETPKKRDFVSSLEGILFIVHTINHTIIVRA